MIRQSTMRVFNFIFSMYRTSVLKISLLLSYMRGIARNKYGLRLQLIWKEEMEVSAHYAGVPCWIPHSSKAHGQRR